MLEDWETALVVGFVFLVFGFITFGLVSYLPQHISAMSRRAQYYLLGQDAPGQREWRTTHGMEL